MAALPYRETGPGHAAVRRSRLATRQHSLGERARQSIDKSEYTAAIVIPHQIGPYRVTERLGAGGMGEVYRAHDHRLDRWVAIKAIRRDGDEDEPADDTARERFRREARAVAGLSHPNIVQIHDIVEWEEGDCIVMELVEGEPLAGMLRDGPLTLQRVLSIGRQIAEGLATAHAKGVIHRDLKAENVMITAEGRAKILDFGLAKRLGPTTKDPTLSIHGKVMGTSYAMSPEQAQGLTVDARSDLFSLGALLYELATGEAPFRRETLAQTLTWVCTRDPAPAHDVEPGVPPALSELISHLLAKDPDDRPANANHVAELLRYLERDSEISLEGTLPPRTGVGVEELGEPTRATVLDLPRPAYVHARGTTPSVGRLSGETPGARRRWRRGLLGAAGLGVAAALAALAVFLFSGAVEGETYVAVQAPVLVTTGEVPSAELIPSAVRVALLQELLSLQGITTLAPDQVDTAEGTSVEVARTLAADEVIRSRLSCLGATCQATLERIRGTDGSLLWTQMFEVRSDDLLRLANGMGSQIRRAYADRGLRSNGGSDRLDVAGEDYEEYLRIRETFRTRLEGADLGELLERLERVRASSPRFVPTYLLEAEVARTRFAEESRNEQDLNRAFEAIRAASDLAPAAPEPLFNLVDTALTADRLGLAEDAVEQLESLKPGEAKVQVQKAVVLVRRGRAAEGLELMRSAVAQRPSEENLIRLANMEIQQGEMDAARDHLTTLLERAPDSYVGRAQLAMVELISGGIDRAAALYEELVRRSPSDAMWSNLGLAYMLQGHPEQAAEAFRSVLDSERNPSPFAVLNLADAELLSGRDKEARRLYLQALDLTASDPAGSSWQILTIQAQALAHLNRPTEAVAVIQRALQTAPENTQVAYEAALIYSLAGERRSALVNVRRAIQQGYVLAWFQFPWFDALRDDPEFQHILEAAGS